MLNPSWVQCGEGGPLLLNKVQPGCPCHPQPMYGAGVRMGLHDEVATECKFHLRSDPLSYLFEVLQLKELEY